MRSAHHDLIKIEPAFCLGILAKNASVLRSSISFISVTQVIILPLVYCFVFIFYQNCSHYLMRYWVVIKKHALALKILFTHGYQKAYYAQKWIKDYYFCFSLSMLNKRIKALRS